MFFLFPTPSTGEMALRCAAHTGSCSRALPQESSWGTGRPVLAPDGAGVLWGQGQEALRPGSPPDPSRLPSVRVGGSAPCGCAWSLTGSSRRELGVLPRWELAPSVEPSPTEHTSCLGGHCPFLGFPGGVVCSGAVIPASQRSSLSVCLRQF